MISRSSSAFGLYHFSAFIIILFQEKKIIYFGILHSSYFISLILFFFYVFLFIFSILII